MINNNELSCSHKYGESKTTTRDDDTYIITITCCLCNKKIEIENNKLISNASAPEHDAYLQEGSV